MENIDLYATHSEYLKTIFEIKTKIKNTIEFGTGNYSTGLLIDNSEHCISIEMQSEEWYNKMVEKFGEKKNWSHYLKIGPLDWQTIDLSSFEFDFGFVDGHGSSRPECINFLMSGNCPIIVSHDTEEPGYGWNRVNTQNEYRSLTFKKHKNWTTIWTTDNELLNQLKNKFKDEL